LAFSRQQALTPESIDPNKFVSGLSDLLRRTLGEAVQIEIVLAGGLWKTHADANQLESAVLNLSINARDAMPDGGKLTIETLNAHLDEHYAAQHVEVPAGQYVLIAVTDTGMGMPPDVVSRAFDPFFTTKEIGKGTGLGLSQVFGFVKQSGGHIKIYSEVGQGTTVKLYLPRFIGSEQVAEESARPNRAAGNPSESILVVEDEERVRSLTVGCLRELGYTVQHADSAAAALRILDADPAIRLLFTDIVMPEINGRKLADEALRRRPELRVLFTTGYTRNAIVHNGVLDPGVHLIGKPFTIDQLAAKVRDILDGA
jgi:CheY-like chemotaxis protein